ncbi:hypothetical protein ACMFMG_003221 [Clarireedia jacksonii]
MENQVYEAPIPSGNELYLVLQKRRDDNGQANFVWRFIHMRQVDETLFIEQIWTMSEEPQEDGWRRMELEKKDVTIETATICSKDFRSVRLGAVIGTEECFNKFWTSSASLNADDESYELLTREDAENVLSVLQTGRQRYLDSDKYRKMHTRFPREFCDIDPETSATCVGSVSRQTRRCRRQIVQEKRHPAARILNEMESIDVSEQGERLSDQMQEHIRDLLDLLLCRYHRRNSSNPQDAKSFTVWCRELQRRIQANLPSPQRNSSRRSNSPDRRIRLLEEQVAQINVEIAQLKLELLQQTPQRNEEVYSGLDQAGIPRTRGGWRSPGHHMGRRHQDDWLNDMHIADSEAGDELLHVQLAVRQSPLFPQYVDVQHITRSDEQREDEPRLNVPRQQQPVFVIHFQQLVEGRRQHLPTARALAPTGHETHISPSLNAREQA